MALGRNGADVDVAPARVPIMHARDRLLRRLCRIVGAEKDAGLLGAASKAIDETSRIEVAAAPFQALAPVEDERLAKLLKVRLVMAFGLVDQLTECAVGLHPVGAEGDALGVILTPKPDDVEVACRGSVAGHHAAA